MTELDRALADSLKAVRDAHVAAIADVLPVDRIEIAWRIRRRRLVQSVALAGAAAAIVVGGVVVVPSLGSGDQTPLPPANESATPTPSPSATKVFGPSRLERRCGIPLPFEPTYLPRGVDPGPFSPEQMTVPVLDLPGTVAHFGRPDRPAIYVIANRSHYDPTATEALTVAGARGTIGNIHEGVQVDFRFEGCNYALIAYGPLDRDDVRRFAGGLRRVRSDRAGDRSTEE